MREELHNLVDQLPEAELKPALRLICGRIHGGRSLPFFGSFEADPDLGQRFEDIMRTVNPG